MEGIRNDHPIIQYLLIHLTEGTRAQLEHLSSDTIHDRADLGKAFIENFQGTYKHPVSS
jgi:hypothetical protein